MVSSLFRISLPDDTQTFYRLCLKRKIYDELSEFEYWLQTYNGNKNRKLVIAVERNTFSSLKKFFEMHAINRYLCDLYVQYK